jgi:hypothetical protein
MKIESFERNSADQVVAISGDTKVVLSWDYIMDYKPQVGDSFIIVDGVPTPSSEVEEAVTEMAAIEVEVQQEIPVEHIEP